MDLPVIVSLSYALIFIFMCLSAALFFMISPARGEIQLKEPLKYFLLFFLISAFSYIIFMGRPYMPAAFSIPLSNILSLTAMYALLTGLAWRSKGKWVHLHKNPIYWGNMLLIFVLNTVLFHVLFDSFMYRVFILLSNITLIYLSSLTVLQKTPDQPTKGEKVVRACILLAAVFAIIAILPILTGNEALYISVTMVLWSIQITLWLGSLLTLCLSDMIELHYQNSITDPLTGIFNRRYFMQQAQTTMKSAERHHFPISIILCDIDRFKSINDRFGHETGDKAIQAIASCIDKEKRDDDILARFGGEEFVLLLPQTDIDGAHLFAERLRKAIEELPLATNEGDIAMTASFGVSTLTLKGDIEQQISLADMALYHAKKQGRNRVCDYGDKEVTTSA